MTQSMGTTTFYIEFTKMTIIDFFQVLGQIFYLNRNFR
ncbi:hypothetical protein LEP1GSC137_4248 [Leptospira borgpetersenii str. Noumea 25]|uniref:Uncharacterized protein n=4 Tax=Leptospira borgpetersenii TaxID=174 RepID=M3GZF2_LEPBO|nr:hypothetical protein LBBP_01688 [Leptospira borgpetersenii serovar Ballum]EKP11941.1 hypothetical protein LEP1GSC128_0360 [Leptospira borgpetersenii str. 200801926]EKQ89983.1 hypothetical protein LEP1GSC101_2339 [Leptospira borgpetersenii str. UI 09149]EKR00492.1 hypothetical protein LEP1GSC121_1082 [Leptospira borgpetersenii serovar Castellonis str. 200801910]EMG00224.1 hypothetical protein LEP1GSC123_1361 [Leptospira borgpetersenii str. 200701203]EMK08782.1 hypothetical protein LEP1GSC066